MYFYKPRKLSKVNSSYLNNAILLCFRTSENGVGIFIGVVSRTSWLRQVKAFPRHHLNQAAPHFWINHLSISHPVTLFDLFSVLRLSNWKSAGERSCLMCTSAFPMPDKETHSETLTGQRLQYTLPGLLMYTEDPGVGLTGLVKKSIKLFLTVTILFKCLFLKSTD